jgi:hypothetical protein
VRDIVDLRGSQQAYVAAGQGDQFWREKVTAAIAGLQGELAGLRAASTAPAAQTSLDAALAALRDFEQMDRRAREYARNRQHLLASDIIFADGLTLTSAAATAVDEARLAELAERSVTLAGVRNRQLFALGAAAAAALLVIVLLVPQPEQMAEPEAEPLPKPLPASAAEPIDALDAIVTPDEGWSPPKRAAAEVTAAAPPPSPVQIPAPALNLGNLASLCTDLARLVDTRSLPSMLERAASELDANGIVLWIADPDGKELSPIITHGYAPNVVNRLGMIRRDDQNATAAAFRTGLLQTVKTDAVSNGAIAAPLVTPGGCVGVMAAEVRKHGEQDTVTLAVATIVAAQLATLVGPPSARASKAEAAG